MIVVSNTYSSTSQVHESGPLSMEVLIRRVKSMVIMSLARKRAGNEVGEWGRNEPSQPSAIQSVQEKPSLFRPVLLCASYEAAGSKYFGGMRKYLGFQVGL